MHLSTLMFYMDNLEWVLLAIGWYYTFRGRTERAFLWYAPGFASMGFRHDMMGRPYFWTGYAVSAICLLLAFAGRKRQSQ